MYTTGLSSHFILGLNFANGNFFETQRGLKINGQKLFFAHDCKL